MGKWSGREKGEGVREMGGGMGGERVRVREGKSSSPQCSLAVDATVYLPLRRFEASSLIVKRPVA